jgi:hypothetical protein
VIKALELLEVAIPKLHTICHIRECVEARFRIFTLAKTFWHEEGRLTDSCLEVFFNRPFIRRVKTSVLDNEFVAAMFR